MRESLAALAKEIGQLYGLGAPDEIEVIEEPRPAVAVQEDKEKTYRAILIVGSALTMFLVGAGIGHLITRR